MHTRKITVREFVGDVRSGMSDGDLLVKYALSQKQLFEVYEKLLDVKKLSPADLERQEPVDEFIPASPGVCPECGANKVSETELCPQCGAGDSLTVVNHKRPREKTVPPVEAPRPLEHPKLAVDDSQVLEARLDVSRGAKVHADWTAPSGEYDLAWHTLHGSRIKRRLLTGKQIVYLCLGAAFLGAILFLGLAFYDEIETYVTQWWRSAPAGKPQSAPEGPDRSSVLPEAPTQRDRIHVGPWHTSASTTLRRNQNSQSVLKAHLFPDKVPLE